MTEREIKLAFSGPGPARSAILAIGAVPLRARRLQDDTLYDTADAALRARSSILRLRRDGERSAVTWKGPAEPDTMKVRDERETCLDDIEVLRHVLEVLGLEPWFRYQKFREEFEAPGVTIAIDETPVGTFVEIEGTEHGILAAAAALGRSPEDFILESYRSLFVSHAQAHGLAGRDMLFDQR